MLVQLHSVSDDFCSWAEGCDCHAFLRPHRRQNSFSRQRAEYSLEAEQLKAARSVLGLSAADGGDGVSFVCPMAGRRAPDLACKAALRHFQHLSEERLQDLMHSGLGIDLAEMQEVLTDFSQGRSAMQAYAFQKLQCWDVLPWKLAGIGHADGALALECAKQCLKDFADGPKDPHLHHRLAWANLIEGAAFRTELEKFIAGATLPELPCLSSVVRIWSG